MSLQYAENLSHSCRRGKHFLGFHYEVCSLICPSGVFAHSISSVVKEINRINQKELELGLNGASWHDEYKGSAYIFAGGLPVDLTEGDVITIFSQCVSCDVSLILCQS